MVTLCLINTVAMPLSSHGAPPRLGHVASELLFSPPGARVQVPGPALQRGSDPQRNE